MDRTLLLRGFLCALLWIEEAVSRESQDGDVYAEAGSHGSCPWAGEFYTFGPNCEYPCRCSSRESRCDLTTGACPNSWCQAGWAGPGCQYRNLAFRMPATGTNGLGSPQYVTDDNLGSCTTSGTLTDPSVRVTLDEEIMTKEIHIHFKKYGELSRGFSVYLGQTTEIGPLTLCYNDTGNVAATDNQVIATCPDLMRTRYITVMLPGNLPNKILEVCNLAVLESGRILSYNKPVIASSFQPGRDPKYAVDMLSSTLFLTNSESSPWLQIDLGQTYILRRLEFQYNSNAVLNMGLQVYVSNETQSTTFVPTTIKTSNALFPEFAFIQLPNVVARYVSLKASGSALSLQLKDLFVFGTCRKHRCGLTCNDLCYCTDTVRTTAQLTTGLCLEGCERNWRLSNGFCNTSICDQSTYGYECGYTCHCNGMCDPWTGECINKTHTCKPQYYGNTCQAESAIGGFTSVIQGVGNSFFPVLESVDGLNDTCAPVVVGVNPSWVVTMPAPRQINDVLIRVNATNTGFGFEIILEYNGTVVQCDTRGTADDVYTGRCKNKMAQKLRINARSSLHVCEVAVLECSKNTFGRYCSDVCHCFNGEPCDPLTGECPPGGCNLGYKGDTCSTECAPGVYGYNCSQACGHCFEHQPCDTITGDCLKRPCMAGWTGGKCNVECQNGTWGTECAKDCGNCFENEPCNKTTGVCPNGCDRGYTGDNCTQECNRGTYGFNCNMTCGNCTNNDICDIISGACLKGCVIGLQPPLCQQDCNNGTYGDNCQRRCGHCRNNVTCHRISGVCDVSCADGVHIPYNEKQMCDKECRDGTYGFNCTSQCDSDKCSGSDVCDKETGACLQGCLYPGFMEPDCTEVCLDGTYGPACFRMCGLCADDQPCNKTTGVCPFGCAEGFLGDLCDTKDTALAGVSLALLIIGVLFLVAGLLGLAFGLWVYKKGTLPWAGVQMRLKEKRIRKEKKRNFSVVSQVYENNTNSGETDLKLKRTNSSQDYEISKTQPRGMLAVKDFWEFTQDIKSKRQELIQQFKDLPLGLTHPCETAKKAQNLRKNRYKEIFAYDHSRVKLDAWEGDPGNDYTNACYINGYNKPHMYIASQGPTEEFVGDFWRMIWQKKCSKIIMLTRLVEHNKVKCCQYWPDEGQKMYGAVTVEVKDTDTFSDYTIRTFVVSAGAESRLVKHFHLESWSDRHVPEYPSSVIHFLNMIRHADIKENNVPILVHCSAGIGRTGTFLGLDYLLDQANAEGYINVFQCVQNLRSQRVNMVQNQDQYVFLHEAVAEALFCPSIAIHSERFPYHYKSMLKLEPGSKTSKLEHEFEKLQHVTKYHESLKTSFYESEEYIAAKSMENAEKNRTRNILPSDSHRPFLSTRVEGTNDYINAVFLSSYRNPKYFLVTQNPLSDTIVDFWRMVYEYKVCTIITLDRTTKPSEIYWPVESETVTYIPFQLQHVTDVDHVTHIERTIKLTNAGEPKEKALLIKQYECRFWKSDSQVPIAGEGALLAVYEQAQKWQAVNGSPPIVAHCLNGSYKSGLFCVVMATIDRLKHEREVTLQHTLKQMRVNRHQIIPTYEQYRYCHDVIMEYLRLIDPCIGFGI